MTGQPRRQNILPSLRLKRLLQMSVHLRLLPNPCVLLQPHRISKDRLLSAHTRRVPLLTLRLLLRERPPLDLLLRLNRLQRLIRQSNHRQLLLHRLHLIPTALCR